METTSQVEPNGTWHIGVLYVPCFVASLLSSTALPHVYNVHIADCRLTYVSVCVCAQVDAV
jgi:hypothetical protein